MNSIDLVAVLRRQFLPRLLMGAMVPLCVPLVTSEAQSRQAPSAAAQDSTATARLRAERMEDPNVAPARKEGEGPFPRLIIRGVNVIDGYGSAPRGPVDVVVEGNTVVEIDANGMYLMPGLVDLHVHQGTQQKAPESEPYNNLRLANGITTVRGVPRTPEAAREWVRWARTNGADGLKLGAERADIMAALLDESKKLGMGSTAHLQQGGVGQMNDEQTRFGQVARQWSLVTPRSEKWNAFLKNLKERDVTLDPTMTTYLTGRDLVKRMNEPWHSKYTIPSQWAYDEPSRTNHGAYFYNWTTEDEVAWRNFYRVWMLFINDYKNMGGRVTASSDAGFIYSTPGFSTIEEPELLQEAGFTPGEAIRAGTLHAAETLFKPLKRHIEFGVVEPGMLADLVIVDANPFANLKVLYGTGWFRLNDTTGKVEQYGGVMWTIKDGIVYDAKKLLHAIEQWGRSGRRCIGSSALVAGL